MPKFTLTAQLALLPPSSSQLQGIVNTINKHLSTVQANVQINLPKNLANQLTNVNKALISTKKNTQAATDSIEHFGKQSALAIRRFAAFSLATGGFIALAVAIKKSFSEAIKFDREVVRIAQVTGKSVSGLKDLTDEITRLATGFGVSSSKIANVAVTLSQAGISAQDTKKALETLAKTELSATFEDIVDTTEGAIAIMSQFGTSVNELERDLSAINAVSARFAVESSDLITAVRRTGGAFQAAGGSLNELISLFTSVRATTRESAESIATGFRTIFTRIQRPRTVEFLKSLGVELRDLNGQFVGPYEAVQKLSEALREIPSTDPRFAQIVEELGGFRQVSKVIPLIQQFEISQKALNVAQRSGSSLTDDAAKAQQALSVQIAKLGEQFDALLRKISNNAGIRSFIDLTLSLASSLIKVTDALTPLLPLILGLGTAAVFNRAGSFGKGFFPNLTGTGKNKGGVIGFSGGGFVPGSGNRDTVPAMLQPGEFVIRKSAAKALGPKTLNKFNKYAQGGRVDFGAVGLFGNSDEREYPINVGKEKFTAHISSAVIEPNQAKNLEKKIIRPAIAGAAVDSAQALGKSIGARISIPDTVKSIKKLDFATPSGQIFEASLGALGAPYDTEATVQDNFDFPRGIGRLSELFGKQNLASVPVDAKRTLSTDIVRKSVVEKARKFLTGLVGFGGPEGEELTMKDVRDKLVSTKILTPEAANRFKTESVINAFKSSTKQLPFSFEQLEGNRFKRVAKKAAGGPAGTDTVPAMLTPGEFVINKKSASKIGLNNLNKINKFASGGVVGGIGNFVKNKPFEAAFIGTQLTSLIGSFSGMSESVNNVVGKLGALGAQTVLLTTLFKNNPFAKIPDFAKSIESINDDIKNINPIIDKVEKGRAKVGGLIGGFNQIQAGGGILTQAQARKKAALEREELKLSEASAKLESIKQGRLRQINNLQRQQKISNISNTAAAIGGSAAIAGGDFLASSGTNQLKASGGKEGGGLVKAGGLISGAGQGAVVGGLLGSVVPVIGTAVGAAAGAIIGGGLGLANAISNVKSQIEDIKIAETFTKLNASLTRVSSGRATADSQRGLVTDSLTDLNKRFLELGNNTEKLADLQGEFDNSINSIEGFFKGLASTSTTFDEFSRKAGDSLKVFSLFAKVPLNELQEQFKKQIETQNKANTVNIESLKLQELASRRLQFLVGIGAAFKDLELETEVLVGAFDGAANKLTDRSSVFNRIGEIGNTKQLNIASDEVTNLLGPLGDELGNQLKASNTVFRQLPQILIETAQKGLGAEGFDFSSAVEERLGALLKGVSPDVATAILRQVKSSISADVGSEAKDQKIIEEALRNPIELAKKLAGGVEDIAKIFAEASAFLTQNANRILEAFGKRASLEERLTSGVLNIVDLMEAKATQIAEFSNKSLTVGQIEGFDVSRQVALLRTTAVGNAGINNPGLVGGRLNAVQGQRDALQKALEEGTAPRTNANIEQLAKLNTEFEALTKVLEFFGNAAQRTTGLQNALNKELENRKDRQNLLRGVATGSAVDRFKTLQTIAQTKIAASAGTLQGVNPQIADKILTFLEQRPRDQEIFGKKAGDIFDELLGSLIGKENVGPGGKAKTINDKILEIQDAAIKANETLNKSIVSSRDKVDEQIKALEANTAQLRANLTQEAKTKTSADIAAVQTDIGAVRNKVAAGQTLGRFGFNGKNIEDVKRGFSIAKEVAETRAKQAPARDFRLERDVLPKGNINSGNLRDIAATAQENLRRSNLFDPKKVLEIGPKIVGLLDNFSTKVSGGAFNSDDARKSINDLIKKTFGDELEEAQGIGPNAIAKNKAIEQEFSALKIANIGTFSSNMEQIGKAIETLGGANINTLNKDFQTLTDRLTILQARMEELNTVGVTGGTPPVNRAMGGTVPGFGNRDTVPAMLTPGEFVINKASAAAIGIGNLHRMNRFAKGGNVRPKMADAVAKAAARRVASSQAKANRLTNARATIAANRAASADAERNRRRFGFASQNEAVKRGINPKVAAAFSANLASTVDIANRKFGGDTDAAKRASDKNRNNILKQRRANGEIPSAPRFSNDFFTSKRNRDSILTQRKAERRNAPARIPVNPRLIGRAHNQGFATGGLVTGGGGSGFNTDAFNASVVAFSNTASNLANSLNAFPRSIELSARHTVEVIFNGAEVLAKLMPVIQEIAVTEADRAINKMIKNKIPDIGTV